MKGMPSAAAAAETALNSYGSAMRENATWQQSLEGRMAAFRAQFEITASSMINSRWLKWFYEAGRGILRFFGAVDGAVGRWALITVGGSAVYQLFKQIATARVPQQMIAGYKSLFSTIIGIPRKLSDMGNALVTISGLKKNGALTAHSLMKATEGLSAAQTANILISEKQVIADAIRNANTGKGVAADMASIKVTMSRTLVQQGMTQAQVDAAFAEATRTIAVGKGVAADAVHTGVLQKKAITIKGVAVASGKMMLALAKNPLTWIVGAIGALGFFVYRQATANRRQEEQLGLTKENAAETRRLAQEQRAQVQTIDQLVERYTQLRNAMFFDEAARSEVADIQERITELVGGQARNLDLVNGGLSEQLSILREIQREQMILARDATQTAYLTARGVAERGMAHSDVDNLFNRGNWGAINNVIERAGGLDALEGAAREVFVDFVDVIWGINAATDPQGTGFMEVLDLSNFAINAQPIETQIAALQDLRATLSRLEDGVPFVRDVNSVLAQLEPMMNHWNAQRRELVDVAIALADTRQDLSHGQQNFFQNILQQSGMTLAEEMSAFVDRYAGREPTRVALENFMQLDLQDASWQEQRDTYLAAVQDFLDSIQGTGMEEILSDMELIDVALFLRPSLEFVFDDIRQEEIEELVRSRVPDMDFDHFTRHQWNQAATVVGNVPLGMTLDPQGLIAGMALLDAQFTNSVFSLRAFSDEMDKLQNSWDFIADIERDMAGNFGGLTNEMFADIVNRMGEEADLFIDVVNNRKLFDLDAYRQHLLDGERATMEYLASQKRMLEESIGHWRNIQERSMQPGTENDPIAQREHHRLTGYALRQIESAEAAHAALANQLAMTEAGYMNINRAVNDYIESLSRMDSAMSAAQRVLEEMDSQGHVTIETFKEMYALDPTIGDHLQEVNGRLVVNTASWQSNGAAIAQARKAMEQHAAKMRKFEQPSNAMIQIQAYLVQQYRDLRAGIISVAEAKGRLSDSLDSLSSKYATLTGAIEEFNEYGDFSMRTVMRLLELGEDYLSMLEWTNGELVLNTDVIDARLAAMKEDMKATQHAIFAERVRSIVLQDLGRAMDTTGDTAESQTLRFQSMGEALADVAKYGADAALSMMAIRHAVSDEDISGLGLSQDAIDAIRQAAEDLRGALGLIGSISADRTRNLGNRSTAATGDDWLDEANRQIDELRFMRDMQLISEQEFFERLDEINRNFFADREQYVDEWRRLELITYRLIDVNPIAQGCAA